MYSFVTVVDVYSPPEVVGVHKVEGVNYYVSDSKTDDLTWIDAKQRCIDIGGDLPYKPTPEQKTYFTSMIIDIN